MIGGLIPRFVGQPHGPALRPALRQKSIIGLERNDLEGRNIYQSFIGNF